MDLQPYRSEMIDRQRILTDGAPLVLVIGPTAKDRVAKLHEVLEADTESRLLYRDYAKYGTPGKVQAIIVTPDQYEGILDYPEGMGDDQDQFDTSYFMRHDRVAFVESPTRRHTLLRAAGEALRGFPAFMTLPFSSEDELRAYLTTLDGPTERLTPELWSRVLAPTPLAYICA
jgi:hypothetical protein